MTRMFWEYPVTGDRASHAQAGVGPATDYGVPWGTKLYTPFAGSVRRFENGPGGRSLELTGSDFIMVVQHLESRDVNDGASVAWRQHFATSGNTGTATTGPHVHAYIIVRKTGERIAFEEWLNWYVRNEPASNPAPAPSRSYFNVPSEGQYYYWHYNNALNGNYDRSQLLRGGQRLEVVENPGTGPVRVRAADGDLVWVGTRNNPATVS